MESIWLLFLVGVGLLLVAADTLVKAAEHWALKIRLSPLIIGSTLLALGTSLPELTVSLIASLQGDVDLALSNIIGSNITNLLLVLPLAALVSPLRIGTTKTQRNGWIMLLVTGIFVVVTAWWWTALAGWGLILGAVGFTCLEYWWGVNGRTHEDKQQFKRKERSNTHTLALLVIALVGVVIGGVLTVRGAEALALSWGLTTSLVGLTLVALVTSLPEIVVALTSSWQKEAKLAEGSILGSNIYNILLIGGLIVITSAGEKQLHPGLIGFSLSAVAVVWLLRQYCGRAWPKYVSGLLLGAYGVFAWFSLRPSF
ncbi:hypothetical protein A2W24_04275 [Microgenomates group bacterium RBG_16_45_19]|nr:MAG: hypothetical protein A2W24_04275 [Microgenomates group bacterium RBG_16_45_19]